MLRGLFALIPLLALAVPAHAQEARAEDAGLRVEIEPPTDLHQGDRAEAVVRVYGAGEHPLLLTPRSEGMAVEVVRGRLLRADARDPSATVLELRVPLVARAVGTAVLRVHAAGYACEARCRLVEVEASAPVRVAPARVEAEQKGTAKQDALSATPSSPPTDGEEGEGRPPRRERHSSLSWVRLPGAEGCVASQELARAIEERIGRHVFVSAAEADLAVEGRAERGDGGSWRAVLQITDASGESLGERTLESRAEGCEELGALLAVTVGLMIDPLTAPERTEDTPPVETRVIVRTEHVVERVEVPVPPAEPPPGWRVEIDAVLVGALGLTPTPTIGGTSTVILEPPGFVPVLLEGTLLPFSRASSSAGHADFLQVHAGLQICPLAIREGGLALHGCIGADAGAVIVIGGDLAVDEGERLIGQGHVALRGHWDVFGPLTIRAGLHLLIPFRQGEAFTVGGGTEQLYLPEPVAGLVDLGVGVHF